MTVATARSILHLLGVALITVGAVFVAQSVLGWIQAALTMQSVGASMTEELVMQFVFGLLLQGCWVMAGFVLVSKRDSLAENIAGE